MIEFLREDTMSLEFLVKMKVFAHCERGATAIEYGLIAAGIAVAISVVVFTVGTDLVALFSGIGTSVASATPAA
jgi:pilus assembly protein Flp/PilA